MPRTLLEALNPAQESAVEHGEGPLLILAGAGTGKTRTITRRVAYLVQARGVPASRILAITFTNKAAREMRSRIREWVPDTGMWVGTFHATCARMLRMDPEPIGRSRDFTIQDEDDRKRLIRSIIKDLGWDPTVFKPRPMQTMISSWKRRRMEPAAAAEEAALYGMKEERAAVVYERYQRQLAKQDALDFDDLLGKGLELVNLDAQGARRWTRRFDHVLVDEYQDTNEIQYLLVKALAAEHLNLAVCGDPDQSIYRWRGADIQNILDFEHDFPGTEVVRLEQNYRSVRNVLKAAQAVIRHNRSRKEKDLVTEREDGPPLTVQDSPDEEMEALTVAQKVREWVRAGTPQKEIAVFYRTNACSRPLEGAFTRLQLPYQVVGGLSFFERREIKDLLAYGRMLVNPRDDVAVERILNVPPRAIGKTTIERLRAYAGEFDEGLLPVMRRSEVREALGARAKKAINGFLALYVNLSDRSAKAEDALRATIDRTGYRRYAEALGDTEDVDRLENIDELLAFASEYDERSDGGLRGFLEEVALLTDHDRWEEGAQRVSLMTVHTAKGLEFDRVAVVGLEEGLFPHVRALEDPDGLEEERRLFYVALTRAREELFLSHSRLRFRTGAPGPQTGSRFLDEIPEMLLAGESEEDVLPEQTVEEGGSSDFAAEDWVQHRSFGVGRVEKVIGSGINQRVVVRFEEEDDARHLLVAYAPLEKLE
ncbi:MAG: UvrD-helicase domain-containing protein [Planctomycetes bacterium]|nr:UvrD-helicase domain-containing protein [Planctomycetota bacterium]MBL7008994.1 UvrD-helicase domain-containing protein [Planctomycetota bacterium]